MHNNSKPLLGFFVAISFVSCVFAFLGQSTRPTLADGAIVPQPVSYSPMDGAFIPSGLTARTSKLRMACYPAGVGCTKNSDCCTGFCRSGTVASYCDSP